MLTRGSVENGGRRVRQGFGGSSEDPSGSARVRRLREGWAVCWLVLILQTQCIQPAMHADSGTETPLETVPARLPDAPYQPTQDPSMGAGAALPGPSAMASDTSEDATEGETEPPAEPAGPAYLHADLWLRWANGRTRCGALAKFWWMCRQMGCAEAAAYENAYRACDPKAIVDGQVGPEKQGAEDTCGRGPYGTCDVRATFGDPPDFYPAHFYWEGCTWNGGWAGAALLVFDPPLGSLGEVEQRGLSSARIIKTSAPGEDDYHGLENKGLGCVMVNKQPGDDKNEVYTQPWGGFAWIPLEPGREVSVLACAGSGCGGPLFNPSGRQENLDPPVPLLTLHTVTPEAGKHYFIGLHRDGEVQPLAAPAPPEALCQGFALTGTDIGDGASCR